MKVRIENATKKKLLNIEKKGEKSHPDLSLINLERDRNRLPFNVLHSLTDCQLTIAISHPESEEKMGEISGIPRLQMNQD